jgi:hypothetical protein
MRNDVRERPVRTGAARIALVAIALASAVFLPLPVASAHLARSFDACIGFYPPEGLCRNTVDYLVGDHPHIRATVEPAHADLRAALWRRVPHQAWVKLRTVAINAQGRMVHEWTPQPGDARPHHPYRFRFVIHGHGTSDIVRLWIFKPDF